MTNLFRSVAFVCLIAVAGSCSSSTAPETSAVESDAPSTSGSVCDLATDQEISALVENQVLGLEINATLCEYSLVDGAASVDGTAVDVFKNTASDDKCSLEFDLAGSVDPQPNAELGTVAHWAGGARIAQLYVCTGDSFLTITQYKTGDVTDDQALDRATDIAEIVISRL